MSLFRTSHVRPPLVFFFIGIIFFCYSNTFKASWHLDDEPNILTNSNLHITELTLHQLSRTLRAQPDGKQDKIYRPLPCLTFGLNWYIGQDNVFGYHVVNLAIHILTAWFLFLTLHLLLHIHYQKKYPPRFFISAALLAALLWALAPIQTQAVTYIVQRMASMAGLFTIIAIYTYLRGRSITKRKYLWLALCFFSFLAALASKENAVLLPASLLLLELSFFQHHITNKKILLITSSGCVLLLIAVLFVRYGLGISPFTRWTFSDLLDSYASRSFTLSERLLTEPRILLLYLSQIFLPIADHLSIEHDIILSQSILSPWTTLPAILTILLIIITSLFYLKKFPLICFPILFFFLNHAVESTILPLELIFEHRNYIPSFFLFLPLGVFVTHVIYNSIQLSSSGRTAGIFLTILFLIISGQATYTRNLAWSTEETLWNDALHKAPNSSRAAHNLGRYYHEFGQYQKAYYYFQLSLKNAKTAADPKRSQKAALNALASVAYIIGNYEKSRDYYNQCLDIDETDEICLTNSISAYLRSGLPENALIQAKKLINEYPRPINYQYLIALAAYQADDQGIALTRIQKIAGSSVGNHLYMYLAGRILMREHAYTNSLFFFKQANKLSPNTAKYQLALAEAYHANKNFALVEKNIQNLLARYSLPVIIKMLDEITQNELTNNSDKFVEYISAFLPREL
ncbi:MAG: tetratricopeptide repeat protein [Candidatus Electrothrix gigas]